MWDWEEVKFIVAILIFCFVLIFLVAGLVMLSEIPGKNLFNEKHGTDYSLIEWTFAQSTIKNYIHTGEEKTLNIKLKEEK